MESVYVLDETAYEREQGMNEMSIWLRDKKRRFERSTAMPTGVGQDMNFLDAQRTGGIMRGEFNPRAAQAFEEATQKLSDVADKLDAVVEKQAEVVERQATMPPALPDPAVSHGDH